MNFLSTQQNTLSLLLFLSLVSLKYDPKKKRVESSKSRILYSKLVAFIILRVPYLYIGYLYIEGFNNLNHNESNITVMVHRLEFIWLEFCMCLIFVSGILFRKSQEKLLNMVLIVEGDCLNLKIPFKQKTCLIRMRKSTRIILISSIGFCVTLIYLEICLNRTLSMVATLIYFLVCISFLNFNTLLTILLMIVYIQRKLYQIINTNFEKMVCSGYSSAEFKNLLEIHKKLSITIKLFKKSFGITCAALGFCLVALLTCDMYLGPFTTLSLELTAKSIWNAILNSFWVAPSSILFVTLGFECKKTQYEANRISFILERVIFESIDERLKQLV